MRSLTIALCCGLPLLCGAGRLPDFARGWSGQAQLATNDGSLIPYRRLRMSDFRAPHPRPELDEYEEHIAAYVCGHILPTPGLRVETERVHGDGSQQFRGEVRGVAFAAYLDPQCSWWNEIDVDSREDYVLQHEQIHFMIWERSARRLNQRAEEIADRVMGLGETPEEAASETVGLLLEELQEALDEARSLSQAFDEELSGRYEPEAQNRWMQELRLELEELAPSGP